MICKDNAMHPKCHLNRHVSSARHKESIEYISSQWSLSQLIDDAGHEPNLIQALADPDGAFTNSEALLSVFDVPTEVHHCKYNLSLCEY